VLICLASSQFIKIERKYNFVVYAPPESALQTIWTNGNGNKEKGSLGNKFLVLFFYIDFWCFLMLFGALSPKITLVFS